MPNAEGTAFGKYFLLKKIAAGGMGEIYLSKLKGPVGFEKLLVIKRILAHHVENQEFIDMFFAEARVAAQLNHANVVQIYEMGEIEDAYFIAMEYVHGKSLRDVIDRARKRGEHVPPRLAAEMIMKLCDGLSYAHNARDMSGDPLSIVHRDINPHNMLISYSGELKVIDFGIAKSEMSIHKTETGTIKGKFVYMSPEQSAAEPLDKRSDIFSVGICLYEALTGFNPFAKANVVLSLDAIQRREPPPVGEHAPRLAPFDAIVKKGLAKEADTRYQDCSEMREDLQAIIRNGDVPDYPQTLAEYMHDLFEEQIEDEKRMILETDSANTSQLRKMRNFRKNEHSSGSGAAHRPGELQAAHSAAADVDYFVEDEKHSRSPFLLMLVAITAFTAVTAYAVTSLVERQAANTPPPPQETPAIASAVPADEGEKKVEDTPAEPSEEVATAKQPTKPIKKSSRRKPYRRPPKPPTKPAPPPKPAEVKPTPPPPPANFGSIRVSSVPPSTVSRGQSWTLKKKEGSFKLSSTHHPFDVTIRYAVNGNSINLKVNSDPWSLAFKGSIAQGKVPVSFSASSGKTVIELKNPKSGNLRISVKFDPPR